MKVLHLTTHLNSGGITIYILRLIKTFQKKGIETCVLSSGGDYADAFKARGVKVFDLPIKTKNELSPKVYLNLPRIMQIIREEKIDVLHAHTRITQVMAFWLQTFLKIPVVTTCHGFYKRRLGRRLNPAWGDKVIAISPPVGEHLKNDHKTPMDRIQIVSNGIDIEEIDQYLAQHNLESAKIHFGFSPKDPVIGDIARLVSDKGQEDLIRAMVILKEKFPTIRLLLVGEGKNRAHLEETVQALGLKSHVFFTGALKDITHALAAMDIFAFPATWREGFGLSIVEAMACKKPVVVTNVWALNALITDKENGLLVEAKQPEALADAITQLLRDPVLCDRVSQNARKMVEAKFSISRMAEEIAQVYRDVLGKS